ncbi:MAG: hypothetical protein AAFQ94_01380 [Bacteroidota bacterium]
MKTLTSKFSLILLIFLSVLSSCFEEEDQLTARPFEPEKTSTFVDGFIWGNKFESNDGRATKTTLTLPGGRTKEVFRISLFSSFDLDDGKCQITFRDNHYITFHPPREVGEHELFKADDDYNSVWFNTTSTTTDLKSYSGSIEITAIDETKVVGSIDARIDSQTYVQGDFEVLICQE